MKKNSDDFASIHVFRDSMTMFMVPKKFKKTLPQPNQSQKISREPAKLLLYISFGIGLMMKKMKSTSRN
jgi:hypothetical protein